MKTKVLTDLDRWTEQRIWDKVLKDVRVVVSTYDVLADTLGYGFVPMSRLAPLILDEGITHVKALKHANNHDKAIMGSKVQKSKTMPDALTRNNGRNLCFEVWKTSPSEA